MAREKVGLSVVNELSGEIRVLCDLYCLFVGTLMIKSNEKLPVKGANLSLVMKTMSESSNHESAPSSGSNRNQLDRQSIAMLQQQAALQFNIKPKKCIEFLVSKELVREGNAEDVANYLFTFIALVSKRRLGEYLGGGKDFNRGVCECFMRKMEFEDATLDGALRTLLKTFRLPGEAQMIDRILEKFAMIYHEHNPGVFNSADTVYILSFSVIMLNTDLHNKNIKEEKKMTLAQFLRNNRNIDDGECVSAELLGQLYHSIKQEEIRMDDADQFESENVAFMAPLKAGWLEKMPETTFTSVLQVSRDKRRWFVLTDGCLYYFAKPGDVDPRGIIPLDNILAGRGDTSRTMHIISSSGGIVKSSKLKDGKMRRGERHTFVLRAKSEEERNEWVVVLQREATKFKPLHDIFIRLQQKKAGKSPAQDDRLVLPRPLARGWMSKRGMSSSTWTRRYFQLFPDFDGQGPTLFYFVSKESAQMMADLGTQTQSGYLRMRSVTKVEYSEEVGNLPGIVVHVNDKSLRWTFVPESSEDDGLYNDNMESDMESVAGTEYNEELDEGFFTSKAAFWHYVLENNAGERETEKKLGSLVESPGKIT